MSRAWFPQVVPTVVAGLLLIVLYSARTTMTTLTLVRAEQASLLVAVVTIAIAGAGRRRRYAFWAYLTAFVLFHLGLPIVAVLRLPLPPAPFVGLDTWWTAQRAAPALYLVDLGLVALVFGTCLASLVRAGRWRRQPRHHRDVEATRLSLSVVGAVVTMLGLFVWVASIVVPKGLAGLAMSYAEFGDIRDHAGFAYANLALGFGLCMLAAGGPSKFRRLGLAAFAIFVVIAFPMGLRGEVLFPGLAAAVALSRGRRLRLNMPVIALLALGVLAASSFVAATRQGNGSGGSLAEQLSPGAAIAELGSSIRPATDAIQLYGPTEPYLNGRSYTGAVEAMVGRLLPGARPPTGDDPRLVASVLNRGRSNGSGIGSSPVAESAANGGAPATVAFFLLLGFALGLLDSMRISALHDATNAVVLFPLIVDVRNGFSPVPSQILFGLILVTIAAILSHTIHAMFMRPDVLVDHRPESRRRPSGGSGPLIDGHPLGQS